MAKGLSQRTTGAGQPREGVALDVGFVEQRATSGLLAVRCTPEVDRRLQADDHDGGMFAVRCGMGLEMLVESLEERLLPGRTGQIKPGQMDGPIGKFFAQETKVGVAGLRDVVGGETKLEANSFLHEHSQFEEIERVLVRAFGTKR